MLIHTGHEVHYEDHISAKWKQNSASSPQNRSCEHTHYVRLPFSYPLINFTPYCIPSFTPKKGRSHPSSKYKCPVGPVVFQNRFVDSREAHVQKNRPEASSATNHPNLGGRASIVFWTKQPLHTRYLTGLALHPIFHSDQLREVSAATHLVEFKSLKSGAAQSLPLLLFFRPLQIHSG